MQLMKRQYMHFLEDKIAFGDIYKVVTFVLESMGPEDDFTLDNLLWPSIDGPVKRQHR